MQAQCEHVLLVPDTYRLRRGHGFVMSYKSRRCKRRASDHFRGHDYCWQHYRQAVANRQDWDVPLHA
jgi:hypothetical protein